MQLAHASSTRFDQPQSVAATRSPWLQALLCLLLALVMWLPLGSHAQQLLPVPPLTGQVIDQTGTLSSAEQAALTAKLSAYEKTKGTQIVVLMVPTTQPEDIASYAQRVASTWKIGRRDVGDGVLIVVAKDDRRMRMEVAKKLEGVLPDLLAARILDNTMRDKFRQNDYAGGLNAAIDVTQKVIDGEQLPPVRPEGHYPAGEGGIDWMLIVMLVVMGGLVGGGILKAILGRFLGSVATGGVVGAGTYLLTSALLGAGVAGVAAAVIALLTGAFSGRGGGGGSGMGGGRRGPIIITGDPFGGGWGGGGGGWSGGDGGFSSGGGGDFGGGGASGDW